MSLRVYWDTDSGRHETFSDEAGYSFNDAGLLVIEDNGRRRTFAPHAWAWIEEETGT